MKIKANNQAQFKFAMTMALMLSGKNQHDLCKEIGVHLTQLSLQISGKKQLPDAYLPAFCEAVNLDVFEVLDREFDFAKLARSYQRLQ